MEIRFTVYVLKENSDLTLKKKLQNFLYFPILDKIYKILAIPDS